MLNINKKYIYRRPGEFDYSKIPIINLTKNLELPIRYVINNHFLDSRTVNFHKDEPVKRMIPEIDLVEEERYKKFGAKVDVNSSKLYETFNKRTYKLPVFDENGNMKMIPGPAPQNPMTQNYPFNDVLSNPYLLTYRITQILSESRQHHAVPDDPNVALNNINININELKDEIKLIINNILIQIIEGKEINKKLMESLSKLIKLETPSKESSIISDAIISGDIIFIDSQELLEANVSTSIPVYEFLIRKAGIATAQRFRRYIQNLPFIKENKQVNLTELLVTFLTTGNKPIADIGTIDKEEQLWNDNEFRQKTIHGMMADEFMMNNRFYIDSDNISPVELERYVPELSEYILKNRILTVSAINILKRRYKKLISSDDTKNTRINLNQMIIMSHAINSELYPLNIEEEKKEEKEDIDVDLEQSPSPTPALNEDDIGPISHGDTNLLQIMVDSYKCPVMKIGDDIDQEYRSTVLKRNSKIGNMERFITVELMSSKNKGSSTFVDSKTKTKLNIKTDKATITILAMDNFVYQKN